LAFGNWQNYLKALELIDRQPSQFYKDLGQGVAHAASVYGGSEYALTHGGNEMPGYHTGPGAHLGFLLGARHSHLDNAGYSLDQKMLSDGKRLSPEQMVDKLMEEEQWRQVLSSLAICSGLSRLPSDSIFWSRLAICYFARGIYTRDVVRRALKIAGCDLPVEQIDALGRDIYHQKFKFKFREGFKITDLRLAERVYQTDSPLGMIDKGFISAAVGYFATKVNQP
jgi:aldehyde:ferredoxin oxidoreductase